MSNLERTAREMGGNTLRITATYANPELRSVLARRYGMIDGPGASDVIVRDLSKKDP
jgi:hypothetical protein